MYGIWYELLSATVLVVLAMCAWRALGMAATRLRVSRSALVLGALTLGWLFSR